MAARTQKQRDQWTRFNTLGTLTSLASWILTKRSIIEAAPISQRTKNKLIIGISFLHKDLLEAAEEMGWKKKV